MNFNLRRPKIFYGWYLVAICVIIIMYTGGIIHFGFTAVFGSIEEEFGWSYAQISLAASLRGFEMGLMAPLIGLLVDRVGPRKLIFVGSFFIFFGFLVLSRVNSLPAFYGAFALIAVGMSTTSGTVLLTAVTNWFRVKANLATGIVVSGFGLGGLLVPVITRLIDAFQWRTAMLIAGTSTLFIVLPLSFLVRHKPEQYGSQPDGIPLDREVDASGFRTPAIVEEVNIPARIALKNRAFWHVALSSMCHSFVLGAIVIHIMPFLGNVGISRSISAIVALLLPVTSIIGRLGAGWFIDRFGNKRVYTGAFILLTTGLVLLGSVNSERIWLLVPFVLTLSLGWGFSVTTRLSMQRNYFGRASFGTILGFVSGIMMLGNIAGAPLAGWVYDTWGSYQTAWLSFAALTIAGVFLAMTLPSFDSTIKMAEEARNRVIAG